MKTTFGKDSFQAFLPDVFKWLDRVPVATVKGLVEGAHHIVGVQAAEENKESITVRSDALPTATQQNITDYVRKIGWKGAGATLAVVDGYNFVLVAATKVKTTLPQKARQFGLDMAKAIKELRVEHLVLCDSNDFDPLNVLDGLSTGLHESVAFKGIRKNEDTIAKLPGRISILTKGDFNQAGWTKQKELGKAIALTRLLQDAPANWLDPIKFAEAAETIAKENKIKCQILDKKEISALGMGSFISVSNGSTIEPRMIVLEIEGQRNDKTVALVGKGLTFDAGGISIKPAAGMGEMKYDMSGGAAVLGAAAYLSKVKPPCKVICLIGAVENMCSGSATRPGDIVVAMNGKTIDVQNTDAEGRLVLADLLHYADAHCKADLIIDIATLTGAVVTALGHAGAGLMTNSQTAGDLVMNASQSVGEPFWQLPLWIELEKEVKCDVADLQNIAKPNVQAGSLLAGVFLKEFVGERAWVHLDIAGTAWSCSATGYPGSGGSAFGLRTMVETCMRFQGF